MSINETPPPYLLRKPEHKPVPFVFSVPHSGRFYPPDFTANAVPKGIDLRQSEDAFVDKLFEGVTQYGACQLVATHARAYLDLNRADNELDPNMFSPALDPDQQTISHRVKAGLGLIPKVIAEGVQIYKAPLPAREALKRRDAIHTPYHTTLRRLLDDMRARYGHAMLIDCHSMPSETGRRTRKKGYDIILGDSWGSACMRELTSFAEEIFLNAGFRVRRNVPYSGGYSTVHYGNPKRNIHALQIEISRDLYMNEATHTELQHFKEVQAALLGVSEALITQTEKFLRSRPLTRAAE